MLTLGYKKVDKFVREQQDLGNDVRWDGWTMIFFRPDRRGERQANDGAFRKGTYGFETRVSANEKGLWDIDWRNVRRKKHR